MPVSSAKLPRTLLHQRGIVIITDYLSLYPGTRAHVYVPSQKILGRVPTQETCKEEMGERSPAEIRRIFEYNLYTLDGIFCVEREVQDQHPENERKQYFVSALSSTTSVILQKEDSRLDLPRIKSAWSGNLPGDTWPPGESLEMLIMRIVVGSPTVTDQYIALALKL